MRKAIATLLFLSLYLSAAGQYVPPAEPEVQANLAEWQDLKFGMFIHWGAYSQWGVIESWSLCPDDIDWQYKARGDMDYFEYRNKYEALKTTFNPVSFDPAKWAAAAAYAGMKYVVFTSKHHDGFCMFDTHQTDYKITSEACPFHTDPRANITRQVLDAYRAQGLRAGVYFSFPDWHNEDYWWRRFPPKSNKINYDPHKHPEKWAAYQDFIAAQLDELSNGDYGDLMLMWYDMPVTDEGRTVEYDWARFAKVVRGNQPGIIMVGRGMKNEYENYLTPEQTIPEEALDYPWESCITMTYSWSWRENLTYKSASTLLSMLVKIVSRGGNFLLNVGPDGRGEWDDDAYDRLREIGDWMQVNSEGIYATKPVKPYQEGPLYYTSKGDCIYAFYIPEEGNEVLPEQIRFSAFVPVSSRAVTLMGSKRPLKWRRTEGGVVVDIPPSLQANPPCEHIWGFKIKIK